MLKIEICKQVDTPVYLQLRDSLKKLIEEKQFQPLSKLPNVTEIAEAAGVSIRTADLALQELVRDGICFRRPKKGTFVGENPCFKQPICGVWSNFSTNQPQTYPMHHYFYSGIAETAKNIGVETVIMTGDTKKLMQRYEQSKEFDFRGVIVFDFDKFDSISALAKEFPEKKFFYLNYLSDKLKSMPENMYAIINDDFAGAYHLVEHAISKQAEKFMILSQKLPLGDCTYQERIRGFCQGINDYSASLLKDAVIEVECAHNGKQQAEYAFLAVKKALRSGGIPDAILCTNDSLALGALRAAQSEKADIQILGYDGIFRNLFGDYYFTTTQVGFYEMAEQALLLMNDKIKADSNIIKLVPQLQTVNAEGAMYA